MNNKPTSINKFIVIVVLFNTLIYQFPLYNFAFNNIDYASLNGVLTLSVLLALNILLSSLSLFSLFLLNSKLVKIFCTIIAFINAGALYFFNSYHTILVRSMIGNILDTRSSEALSLFHPYLLLYFLVLGVIPSWLIWRVKFIPVKRLLLLRNMAMVFIVSLFWMYFNSQTWLWFDKHAKILGGQAMPWSYIINTARFYALQNRKTQIQQLLPMGRFKNNDKMVVVLVIGESARKHNFSLYGYQRNTNPLLQKTNIIALNNPNSCATYTMKSVLCILSYTDSNRESYEPLPSYLHRLGAEVIWRTNNWGEPRINVSAYQERAVLEHLCQGEKCAYDEILLSNLTNTIMQSKYQKIFIILHTKGSHGPDYKERYPKKFEHFKPVCQSVQLSNCSDLELKNAYDNSILYTDYFINKTIQILKKTGLPSMLTYISDHGESLGKYGLYLHGTPISVAPNVQKQIPFLLWLSPEFARNKNINLSQFKQAEKHGQNNIFHTILGAFSIDSSIYNPKLDVLNQP